jgi:hypothetical protein
VEKPPLIRNGQGIAVYVAAETLKGRQGTLVVRWRVEFVGAGNGNTVGTGTWSLVRGTGAYAGVTGGGRLAAVVYTPKGLTSAELEGLSLLLTAGLAPPSRHRRAPRSRNRFSETPVPGRRAHSCCASERELKRTGSIIGFDRQAQRDEGRKRCTTIQTTLSRLE